MSVANTVTGANPCSQQLSNHAPYWRGRPDSGEAVRHRDHLLDHLHFLVVHISCFPSKVGAGHSICSLRVGVLLAGSGTLCAFSCWQRLGPKLRYWVVRNGLFEWGFLLFLKFWQRR